MQPSYRIGPLLSIFLEIKHSHVTNQNKMRKSLTAIVWQRFALKDKQHENLSQSKT